MLFCVKQIRPSGGAKCNWRRSGEAERCCLSQQAPEFCAAALNCTSKNPDQKAAKVIQVCMCEGECVLVCVRESSPSWCSFMNNTCWIFWAPLSSSPLCLPLVGWNRGWKPASRGQHGADCWNCHKLNLPTTLMIGTKADFCNAALTFSEVLL